MPVPLGTYTTPRSGGRRNGNRKTPTQTVKKSVSYVAGSADSNLVLSVSGTDASDAITSIIPSSIEVKNTGAVSYTHLTLPTKRIV